MHFEPEQSLRITGVGFCTGLVRFVADQGNDHAVQVKEKHQEVETKLDERFLLVHVELAEDLGRIQEVLVLEDLLRIENKQRQVQDDSKPVSVDDEQEGQESVNGGFGDDVGVETVAEINRVDVVTFQITVHNRKEDLQEQVDRVDQH